jgi:FtsZ-interacting cell division protein ZipA
MPAHAPKPGMTRRTGWIIVAGIVAALAIITTVVWTNGRSYEDTVADCKKALNSTSTKTNRPDACQDVKANDYDALLVSYSLQHAFDGLSKTDQDTLDYYDDGSINGSIG